MSTTVNLCQRPVGLVNIGQTCFINSFLQCMGSLRCVEDLLFEALPRGTPLDLVLVQHVLRRIVQSSAGRMQLDEKFISHVYARLGAIYNTPQDVRDVLALFLGAYKATVPVDYAKNFSMSLTSFSCPNGHISNENTSDWCLDVGVSPDQFRVDLKKLFSDAAILKSNDTCYCGQANRIHLPTSLPACIPICFIKYSQDLSEIRDDVTISCPEVLTIQGQKYELKCAINYTGTNAKLIGGTLGGNEDDDDVVVKRKEVKSIFKRIKKFLFHKEKKRHSNIEFCIPNSTVEQRRKAVSKASIAVSVPDLKQQPRLLSEKSPPVNSQIPKQSTQSKLRPVKSALVKPSSVQPALRPAKPAMVKPSSPKKPMPRPDKPVLVKPSSPKKPILRPVKQNGPTPVLSYKLTPVERPSPKQSSTAAPAVEKKTPKEIGKAGHYYAYVKRSGTWFLANDSEIEQVSGIGSTKHLSMVFYERM